jgi:S1-C subfamily serine protease
VLILQIEPGSGAEAAGLRGTRIDAHGRPSLGDIIVGIESDRVENVDDLMNALEKYQAGDTVTVAIVRGDERLRVPVTIQASP